MSTFSVHSFSIGFVPKLSQVFLYRTISHFSPLHFYGTLKFHWICSKIAHVFLYRTILHFSPLLWHTQISIRFAQKCRKYFSVGQLKFLHHFFLQVLRTSAVENATTILANFASLEPRSRTCKKNKFNREVYKICDSSVPQKRKHRHRLKITELFGGTGPPLLIYLTMLASQTCVVSSHRWNLLLFISGIIYNIHQYHAGTRYCR